MSNCNKNLPDTDNFFQEEHITLYSEAYRSSLNSVRTSCWTINSEYPRTYFTSFTFSLRERNVLGYLKYWFQEGIFIHSTESEPLAFRICCCVSHFELLTRILKQLSSQAASSKVSSEPCACWDKMLGVQPIFENTHGGYRHYLSLPQAVT